MTSTGVSQGRSPFAVSVIDFAPVNGRVINNIDSAGDPSLVPHRRFDTQISEETRPFAPPVPICSEVAKCHDAGGNLQRR